MFVRRASLRIARSKLSERGATFVEYAIITGAVGIASLGGFSALRASTTDFYRGSANGAGVVECAPVTDCNAYGSLPELPGDPVASSGLPGKPLNFVGTPSDGKIIFSWQQGVGGTPTGYSMLSAAGSCIPVPINATTCTMSGLANYKSFTFSLVAYNSQGNSPVASLTMAATPPPGSPTALAGTPGNTTVALTWSPPSTPPYVTSYLIEYKSASDATWSSSGSTVTSVTISGLTNGTQYSFRVSATNGAGTSSPSVAISVTPAGPPNPPTGVVATADAGSALVSWTAPSYDGGAALTSYVVTSSPGGKTCSTTVPTTSCTVTGLTNGIGYTFAVTATNANGQTSLPSDPSANTIPSLRNQSITFAWSDSGASYRGTSTVAASATSGLVVSFSSTTTGVCAVAGTTVTYVGVGTCTVQADQAGNGTYAAAIPVRQSVQVAQAAQSITFSTPASPRSVGDSATLSATATSGLSVAFDTSTPTVCTVSGTAVNYVAVGTCIVTADQLGSALWLAAPQMTQSVVVRDVPAAPSGLNATSGTSSVSLSWTAPASNGATITDYVIQFKRGSATTWSTFNDGVGASTSANVTGLTPGITYNFRVAATNAVGPGPYSTSAAAPATGTCTTIPLTITGAGASPATVDLLPSDLAGGKISQTPIRTSGNSTGTVAITSPTASGSVVWTYNNNTSPTWTGTYLYTATNCTATTSASALSISK